MGDFKPTDVVNCAAWTRVDDAEDNIEDTFKVNSLGASNIAKACAIGNAFLVQVSTDYVFSGDSEAPNKVNSPTLPNTIYGKSKLEGETSVRRILPTNHYVARTAWLYSEFGKNFVKTVISKAARGEHLRVVDDQFGQPTWAKDVATRIIEMRQHNIQSGTYHLTNSGSTNWFEFSKIIIKNLGADPSMIENVSSQLFKTKAARPHNSTLDHAEWVDSSLNPMRPWEEALNEFMAKNL
jgi:dTDP-4-dehydrorhamnose reductase